MPIINRPSSEAEVEEPKEVSGIISRPKTNFDEKALVDDVELNMGGAEPKPKPQLSFKWVKWGYSRWLFWWLLSLPYSLYRVLVEIAK